MGGAPRGLTELRGVAGRGPEPYTMSMAGRTEQGRAGRASAEQGSRAGQGSVAHEPEPHVISLLPDLPPEAPHVALERLHSHVVQLCLHTGSGHPRRFMAPLPRFGGISVAMMTLGSTELRVLQPPRSYPSVVEHFRFGASTLQNLQN